MSTLLSQRFAADLGAVNMGDTTIGWTRPLLEKFKERYRQAVLNSEIQFVFEINGVKHDFVTAYAKYLIEYLELNLPRGPGPHKTRI